MASPSKQRISEAARRYASALFDMAMDANALRETEDALTAFAAAARDDEALGDLLASPLYSSDDKEAALAAITDKLGMPDLLRRFIGVMAANRRAHDIQGAAAAFVELSAKQRGVRRAIARSAKPLTEAQINDIKSVVSDAVGSDADLEIEIDPRLVGGLQLQIGSRLIDASLRAKLDGIHAAMKGA